MSYNIKNFAQTVTYTVNDSTANTNAVSLTLLGKSLPNYGTYFNQNFVWLMENFSSDSANPPPYPVQGQLWWDSTYKFLNVYDGSAWKTAYGNLATLNVNGAVTINSLSATTVTATNLGGLITTNAQPYITSVGTITSSGAVTANTFNGNAMYAGTIGNTGTSLVGTISTAAQTNITSIGNLTTSLGVGGVYHNWGTRVLTINGSVPALTLGSGSTVYSYIYDTGNFLNIGTVGTVTGRPINIQPSQSTAANGTTTFTFTTSSDLIATNNGQFKGWFTGGIGANTPNTVVGTSVTTSSGGQHIGYHTGAIGANTANTGAFTTITSTSHVTPTANNTSNVGALSTLYANVFGTNYYVANSVIPIANVTADLGSAQRYFEQSYIVDATIANSIIPTSNVTVDVGSASKWFENIYAVNFLGVSTTAQYADLAEKYLLDTDYPIGTVIMIGGDSEATAHDGSSVRAIGAVSEYPAYKMNDGLENGTYVALKGRVPVRVIGPVAKGQSLRGGPSGLAIGENQSTPYTFAIAMETVRDVIETIIEAVIL